uniref:Uncharacterized protein n=1 Tax=Yangshan Harbor Nitrososphaeria virus TaxID=2969597 RepID=A0A976UB26_9CAUD|nr:hypothetical protein [Yangshan Harbor Nitrososphaeria virus]
MFFGKNAYQITETINKDTKLMSQFGKTTPSGVHYHIKNIEKDLEDTISEDAMDTYIGEFIRARTGFENDVSDVEDLMVHEKNKGLDDMDKELYLKLSRFRHEIKLDSFKMLQDSALPLQVKKLKMERNKLRPKKPVAEIINKVEEYGERTSQ